MARVFLVAQLSDTVRAPADADVLGVTPGRVLLAYDPAAPKVDRRFVQVSDGGEIPPRARFVGHYTISPADYLPDAVFELFDADVPADLPDERHADYRLLIAEGYTPAERDVLQCGPPRHSWKAPVDQPAGQMSLDAMQAVARLQEHGYGPVVE